MNKNEQETKNRLDELTNIVEKHTRTERHLENSSQFSSSKSIAQAETKQEQREAQIDTLKDKIIHENDGDTDEVENLEKNYTVTRGYIEHNKDHMDPNDLKNVREKQANREVERRNLEWR